MISGKEIFELKLNLFLFLHYHLTSLNESVAIKEFCKLTSYKVCITLQLCLICLNQDNVLQILDILQEFLMLLSSALNLFIELHFNFLNLLFEFCLIILDVNLFALNLIRFLNKYLLHFLATVI